MKKPVVMLVLISLLAAAAPVAAQHPGGRRAERAGPPEDRPMPQRERGWREHRYDPEAKEERRRHHERMTPEERRQLRRDIHQHGREVYRERRGER